MIDAKKLQDLKEAARDMIHCIKPEMIQPIKEDDRGVVLEGERRREVFIQYHGDSNSETNQKSAGIAQYLISVNPDVLKELIQEIERLAPFEHEAKQWKSNHDAQVERSRILKERLDMPVERVKAYETMTRLAEENKRLQGEIDSLRNEVLTRMMIEMLVSKVSEILSVQQHTQATLESVFKVPQRW